MANLCSILTCGLSKKLSKKSITIPVLRFSGVISDGGGMMSGKSISLEKVNEAIEKAFSTKNAKAVALVINSPGGSPVQSELIYNRIRRLSEQKNIPVFTFAEDAAASGGYWLLCAGDELYACRNSIVGSIGVIASMFGFVGLMKKLGIERRIYSQGDNKSVLDTFSPEKASDVTLIKNLQKEIHDIFISVVKERRGEKLNGTDKELFNGLFWTGGRAKELGLIDGIGTVRDVLEEKFGEDVKLDYITTPKSWLKSKLGVSLGFTSTNLAEQALGVAQERLWWERLGL